MLYFCQDMLQQLYLYYVSVLSCICKKLLVSYIYVSEHLQFTATCHGSYVTFQSHYCNKSYITRYFSVTLGYAEQLHFCCDILQQLCLCYVTTLSRTYKKLFIRYIYVSEHLHFAVICHRSYVTLKSHSCNTSYITRYFCVL